MRKTGRKHDLVAICVAAAVAGWAAHPMPVAADDSGDIDGKQAVDLLKNLQSLEAASSDKAEYEAGFTFLQTFAGIAGQPELVMGLKALQGVLDFTGALSGSAESATTQALVTLAANFKQLDAEVKAQGAQIDTLTQTLASKINSDLKFEVNLIHASLQTQLNALQPPGNPGQLGQLVSGPGGAAVPRVSPAVARQISHDVMAQLDLFIDSQTTLFTGEDIQTVYTSTGQQDSNGRPIRKASLQLAPGFKPYPALNVYLFGLQMWISAMEVESGGTDAGHGRILRDQGFNGQASYPKELQKHIAFLRAMDASGKVGGNANGIEPQIAQNVHCTWSADRYPDGAGKCGAVLVCDDHIARRVLTPAVSTSWMQSDRNAFCNASQAPGANLTSMEQALRYQYGVIAMHKMADALQRVADHGTAVQGKASSPVGNFGTQADAEFFLYAVDGAGGVTNFAGSRNQPFTAPTAAGSLGNVKALIPGGGTTFYALARDGHLNWYQFTGSSSGKPFNGPVTISSSFGTYTSVFGGGDGVIYAIQPDGTLVWFRHAGFATGAPSTLTGPKSVASGFGGYRSVFSAGEGVIYAVGSDGGLQWYRHKNYLTGASDASSQPRVNTGPGRPASGITATPSSLEGPIGVGSGWAGFRQVVPAGNGILLAVQSDGKLAWYRHDDYLTGTSINPPSTNTVVQNARLPAAGGNQAGSESPHAMSAVGAGAQKGTTLESSWGSAGRPAVGTITVAAEAAGSKATTPQWGSQAAHVQAAGVSPSMASTQAAAAASSLHAGSGAKPAGSPTAGTVANANGTSSAAAAALAMPHWEGPTVVAPQSKWDGYAGLAAVLPVTVQSNTIK